MVTRFEIVAVMQETISLFVSNARVLVPIALIVQAPYIIVGAMGQAIPTESTVGALDPSRLLFLFVVMLLGLVLGSITAASVSWAAASALRDERPTIGGAIQAALPLTPLVIGVSVAANMLVFLGFLVFIVPGIVVALMLWVSVPVLVVERVGVIDALRRSRELTSGRRLKIFGTGVVYSLMIAVPALVIFPLAGMFATAGDGLAMAAYGLASTTFTVLATAFSYTLQLYVYHVLRTEKEGTGVEDVAAVLE